PGFTGPRRSIRPARRSRRRDVRDRWTVLRHLPDPARAGEDVVSRHIRDELPDRRGYPPRRVRVAGALRSRHAHRPGARAAGRGRRALSGRTPPPRGESDRLRARDQPAAAGGRADAPAQGLERARGGALSLASRSTGTVAGDPAPARAPG